MIKKIVSVLFLLSFTCLRAGVYYVDNKHPSAADSNPGTETQPWKTIWEAASTIIAGDTDYIQA
ncbi:MAG TPA: hypothetical protein EYP36_04745, partial [Calditrichaeota bacterium]|nr:hypothetical protein [Calditrichota bacterium]